MMQILREEDCPQDPIRGFTVGVLGYGNQGRAHALNLRDSGHAVVVGARPAGRSADIASAEGFYVVAPGSLALQADLIAILTPDETHRSLVELLAAATPDSAMRTRAAVLAHSFSLMYDPPPFPKGWDVLVVAPSGPGDLLRKRYTGGSGIPALYAVHTDCSGEADALGRAYAGAIGCSRAGLLVTTPAAEAEVDLFGEQAVLCGGMNALCTAAFDTLVKAGFPPEMAYLECIQQVRLTAELMERHGIEGMRRRISPTALYGDLSRGGRLIDAQVRARMADLLDEIRTGEFAREWLARAGDSPGWAEEDLARARADTLEKAGETIRGLLRNQRSRDRNGAQ